MRSKLSQMVPVPIPRRVPRKKPIIRQKVPILRSLPRRKIKLWKVKLPRKPSRRELRISQKMPIQRSLPRRKIKLWKVKLPKKPSRRELRTRISQKVPMPIPRSLPRRKIKSWKVISQKVAVPIPRVLLIVKLRVPRNYENQISKMQWRNQSRSTVKGRKKKTQTKPNQIKSCMTLSEATSTLRKVSICIENPPTNKWRMKSLGWTSSIKENLNRLKRTPINRHKSKSKTRMKRRKLAKSNNSRAFRKSTLTTLMIEKMKMPKLLCRRSKLCKRR